MKMMVDIQVEAPEKKIAYGEKIFLIGSCFTEHIGNRLADFKFRIEQNPNGILFDPVSVSNSLLSYIKGKVYHSTDLFYLNELWQSWHHHSMYSGTNQQEVLDRINEKQKQAQAFLAEADWLVITLGSSFSYQLKEQALAVANCHRAPGQWFMKHLLDINEMKLLLNQAIESLLAYNPNLKIIFTVSPVRHIRDGVIENNLSKARLLETVHYLVKKFNQLYYFPAYELVIDVLRDYRFYDIDLVHPNYAATEFVFEQFSAAFIEKEAIFMMEEIRKFNTAYRHKPFQPDTSAHRKFMQTQLEKIMDFQHKYPQLNFTEEIAYFSGETGSFNAPRG